jgi:hypothetical protein
MSQLSEGTGGALTAVDGTGALTSLRDDWPDDAPPPRANAR